MVSKVKVEDTLCGHSAVAKAWKDDEGIIRIGVESECPKLKGFIDELPYIELEMEDLYQVIVGDIYDCAVDNEVPATCPVPTAIVNACWIEVGMVAKSLAQKSTITIGIPPEKAGSKPEGTKMRVDTGVCDYVVLIRAKKTPEGKIKLKIATNCPEIKKGLDRLPEIDPDEISVNNAMKMYEIADELKLTPICFVPLAIACACLIEKGELDREAVEKAGPIKITYPKD
ncbi:MAG: DUF6951 family protein [Methermicoccaceae archaeon]